MCIRDRKIQWLTTRHVELEEKNALAVRLIADQEVEIRKLKYHNDTLKENNKFWRQWRLFFKNLKEKYNIQEDLPAEPEDDSDESEE